jgi:hypothetical protein
MHITPRVRHMCSGSADRCYFGRKVSLSPGGLRDESEGIPVGLPRSRQNR